MKNHEKVTKTLEYLSAHSNWGYSISELADRLEFSRKSVKQILKFLVASNAVEKKTVSDTNYFLFRKLINVKEELKREYIQRWSQFSIIPEDIEQSLRWKGLLDEDSSSSS